MKLAKKMILAAVVLPITLGSAAVFAAGGGNGPGRDFGGDCGRGGMMNPEVFAQLNVTPEQKAKMADLRLKMRDTMQAQRAGKQAEMRAYKQQERDLVMSSNFDEAAAKKLAEQMVQRRAEQRVAMMKQRNEMMNVLTADQKTKLASIQQDRMNECVLFGQGNGQGGKGGQGPRGQGMMRGGPQGQMLPPMAQ
ncbi:CpxP family protein [Vibrio ziniensis]|uniref:CpxP family protein n=1 Tax=Vibrio ziniensis TaxID=2711221 RepID=A0A6G7CEZ4_9VIBR|nr:CpxP family protein [Vibrio ziniensis]QIH40618.1 CpxP family protein [Vibrio ziniensis]